MKKTNDILKIILEKMEKKNEEVNIEALLNYIRQVKGHCKNKEFKAKHAFNLIEIKLLECRLKFIDKKLIEVKNEN